MLRDLRISGFRGLRELAMSGLGRVNLLVGTNNCGKTSVLEAIHMLSAPGNPRPLWDAQVRRGELVDSAERQSDLTHVFHGHELREGRRFLIAGTATNGTRQEVAAELVSRKLEPKDVEEAGGDDGDEDDDDDRGTGAGPLLPPLSLVLDWSGASSRKISRLRISRRGGLGLGRVLASHDASGATSQSAASFITTEGLSRNQVVAMFQQIVLTPDEETVLRALRTIEPNIERIASVGTYVRPSLRDMRGGLAAMVAGQRIPIGSMGDGIWRLLGIAMALVSSRDGVLLIDEIDTGLHYSVLVDMWRLVLETARSLDVQVFATTHSRDCYEALAAVAEPGRTEISLQRIERGKIEAVAFSELEIRQAAERGLEVR
jgi:hypothetical protein